MEQFSQWLCFEPRFSCCIIVQRS
uniref:Uncharacterized protein n=1 Tax=Arundo donax TaxID=35708 RepID=A0A0A8Y103_ARUDO